MATSQNDLQRQVDSALQSIPEAERDELLLNGLYLENCTAKSITSVPTKKVAMDRRSRKQIMIYSTGLNMGDHACKWEYSLVPDDPPRNNKLVEVAELLDGVKVCVEGDCDISNLTEATTYEVVYVVMINIDSHGLTNPVTLKLEDPKGKVTKRDVRLDGMPPNTWAYVLVGDFETEPKHPWVIVKEKVHFSLSEVESGEKKKGLIVKGVAIRPKI